MPTYAYRCAEGHEFEVVHGMSDPPPERCSACRSTKLQKVFLPVGIVLKGPGFHKTDYASKSQSKPSSDEKSEKKAEKTGKAGEAGKPSESKSSGTPNTSD